MAFTSKPILNQQTGVYQTNALQRAMSEPLDALQNFEPLTGILIKNVAVTSLGVTVVRHTLGRPYQGWFTVRLRAPTGASAPVMYEIAQSEELSAFQLTLANYTASTGTFDVWVY